MSQIKQFKTLTAKFKAERAKYESLLTQMQFRPSLNAPVSIRREGGAWLCILETTPDIEDCVHAYGNSPHQAMLNFDQAWYGQPVAGSQAVAEYDGDIDDLDEDDDEDDERGEW